MSKTELCKHYDLNDVYTKDSWEIPEDGTEIWCTGWERGQTIKPCGDGMHVFVGFKTYHIYQLMEILENWVKVGETWGIDGVEMKREQHINGKWVSVDV